jgi:hypothetical protein
VLGVLFAAAMTAAALFGPRLVREGRRLYEPISRVKRTQDDFDRWKRENAWKEPAQAALSAERLEVFLNLRRVLQKLDAEMQDAAAGLRRRREPELLEVPELVQGMTSSVAEQMNAYVNAGMTPGEYDYVERLVYRRWLAPLRERGEDPAARSRAAQEIEAAARAERDSHVASRLREVARGVRERQLAAPDGVPEDVHRLLLSSAQQIQSMADPSGASLARVR